jgi:hypothetical protein
VLFGEVSLNRPLGRRIRWKSWRWILQRDVCFVNGDEWNWLRIVILGMYWSCWTFGFLAMLFQVMYMQWMRCGRVIMNGQWMGGVGDEALGACFNLLSCYLLGVTGETIVWCLVTVTVHCKNQTKLSYALLAKCWVIGRYVCGTLSFNAFKHQAHLENSVPISKKTKLLHYKD